MLKIYKSEITRFLDQHPWGFEANLEIEVIANSGELLFSLVFGIKRWGLVRISEVEGAVSRKTNSIRNSYS
jgi:hypothetical protein